MIEIEDNAGNYLDRGQIGLGMNIVEKRIKNLYGEQYALEVSCTRQEKALISIRLPY
ncbi:MAG: hypothetical protein AB7U29_04040 [Desulfobulbus sp.]